MPGGDPGCPDYSAQRASRRRACAHPEAHGCLGRVVPAPRLEFPPRPGGLWGALAACLADTPGASGLLSALSHTFEGKRRSSWFPLSLTRKPSVEQGRAPRPGDGRAEPQMSWFLTGSRFSLWPEGNCRSHAPSRTPGALLGGLESVEGETNPPSSGLAGSPVGPPAWPKNSCEVQEV